MKTLYWWLILLAVTIAYPLLLGGMSPYQSTVLILIGIYVILAMSLDLLVGYSGQISLGHAAFFAIGAYTSGILCARYAAEPIVALFLGMCFSGAISWIIGWSVLSLRGYYLAMATLGLTVITHTLIVGLQSLTGGASGLADIPSFRLAGFEFTNHVHYYYFVWVVVLLVLGACLTLVNSPFGRTLNAIHSDETAAATVGVDCAKYKVSIFVVSNMFAALAGSLYAHHMSFIAPDDFSVFTSIHILIMIYLGGVGTILGPAIGAVFLKLLPELTYRFHDYELLGNGAILILVLVFMPHGIYGALRAGGKRIKDKCFKRRLSEGQRLLDTNNG
ncbi:MAG: branched-chain amino acid ABC transporter permease [Deltaproteobacteria bacterium]|nr:branched-chain amino acid ABC transporter permease [Deltaproteobacteria bacterium]